MRKMTSIGMHAALALALALAADLVLSGLNDATSISAEDVAALEIASCGLVEFPSPQGLGSFKVFYQV